MTGFKFAKYAYEPDPEFDDYNFIKFENLKGKTIVIHDEHCRLKDDSVKMLITVDGQEFCTFTRAKSIVNTLNNIRNGEGIIPAVPVIIGTYPTGKGNDGYCFKDVEDN